MYTLTVLICLAGSDAGSCNPTNAVAEFAGNKCASQSECMQLGSTIAADHPMRPGEFIKFLVRRLR